MSPLYNEELADKEVIKSLLKEIKRLQGENQMPTLRNDADGNLLVLHQFEELTIPKAEEYVAVLQSDLSKIQSWLEEQKAKLTNDQTSTEDTQNGQDNTAQAATEGQPSEPATPADQAPAAPADEAPANPTQAPADSADQAPVDPNSEAPATDGVATNDTSSTDADVDTSTDTPPLQ